MHMSRDTDTLQPPPQPRSLSPQAPQLKLWVVCSPDPGRHCAGLDVAALVSATVGRSKTATWWIDDGWLSREHFRITAADPSRLGAGPWELTDLDTRNGTWVNGARVSHAVVRHGDVVRAGATVFVIGAGVAADEHQGLLGRSAHLGELRQMIGALGASNLPVHITGESGVGKEVLAEAIHRASARSGPFLAVNSAALVPTLAESQLFGHRRGAFSGADKDATGAFDAANGGTLLLDEIGELDVGLQANLLRVVECAEVHRLGDSRPHPVDVRLITATHRNLERQISAGQFREDLYWRIAHTVVAVLPLRSRRLDIVPIADHVLERNGVPTIAQVARAQGHAAWQAAELVERYLLYSWPGNVRELRDEVTRLTEAMTIRQRASATSPLPPLDEALSHRLRTHVRHDPAIAGAVVAEPEPPVRPLPSTRGHATAEHQAMSPDEVRRVEALLADRAALQRAIRTESNGNIRAFAERTAVVLGRQPDTVRRHIYRVLGEGLAVMRRDPRGTAEGP